MKKMNKEKSYFEKNGYVILKDFLSIKETGDLKKMLIDGYKKYLEVDVSEDNISQKIVDYEKKGFHDQLYSAFKAIHSSSYFKKIGQKLSEFSKKELNLNTKLINTGYAIGIKDAKRTAYDWHQEKPYYKNINTIHFQFPMIYPCNEKNGTMSVLEGSHTLGYIKDVSNVKLDKKSVNSFVPKQMDEYLDIYPEKSINMSLRDVAIFDQNIIHRTNKSYVEEVRFAGIIRLEVI